ncbi:MAG: OPT/YSL family transporter [Planctomycetota bacterium]
MTAPHRKSPPSVPADDRAWLDHAYRGDVPQFTCRAVVVGFLLGSGLSITNLYIGAKIGVTMGVGLTAAILAASFFKMLGPWTRHPFHLLETNTVLAIAGAAGYIVSPLTASLAAYMMITGMHVDGWQLVGWLCGLACMGVVLAIPWKRTFVNNAAFPFPEGTAAAVTIEALHADSESNLPTAADASPPVIRRPARQLLLFGLLAGLIRLGQSGTLLARLGLGKWRIPQMLDEWYYTLATQSGWYSPTLGGVTLRQLTIRPSFDVAILGIGGLMGIRTGVSLLVGAIINYGILAPWMVSRGDIPSRVVASGETLVGFRAITTWSLWAGVALMTSASLWSLLVQRKAFMQRESLATLTQPRAESAASDDVGRLEIPWTWMLGGGAAACLLLCWMGSQWFGVPIGMTAVALVIAVVTSVIAIHATALTSITPTGALGRLGQLGVGLLIPRDMGTNVLAGGLGAESALQAATLTQNLKTAYLLGAKPRWIVVGHLVGAFAGALASVFVFQGLFFHQNPEQLISDEFPFPAAAVWKAVAELFAGGSGALPTSASRAALCAVGIGIAIQIATVRLPQVPLSALAIGLAFVIPFHVSLGIFCGAFAFWLVEPRADRTTSGWRRYLTRHRELICSGTVAGAAIAGVIVMAIEVLLSA